MSNKLEECKKAQEELKQQLLSLSADLQVLLKEEVVQDYVTKMEQFTKLKQKYQQNELEIVQEEMRTCSHIWVTSEVYREWDGHRTDKCAYHTCIKCGLEEKARYCDTRFATSLEFIMRSILREHYYLPGKKTDILCEANLAKGVYAKIKEAHPDISDEQAIVYLKHALSSIRTHEKTEVVRHKRIKRLGLNPNFHQWYSKDIICGD